MSESIIESVKSSLSLLEKIKSIKGEDFAEGLLVGVELASASKETKED